jgi:hypothetical protein
MDVSGYLRSLDDLFRGEGPLYPFDRRLGWSQSQTGSYVEDKRIPAPAGDRTPVQPVV